MMLLQGFLVRTGLHGKFALLIGCWLLMVFGAAMTAITVTGEPVGATRTRDLAVGIGLTLLGTAAFTSVLVRTVTRPIARLIAGTRAVAGGDLDTRIEIRTNDELEVLARSFNDMTTSLRRMTDRLHSSAIRDSLTGLANRTLFMDRLRHVIDRASRRDAQDFAVIFIDVDRFKLLNDSFGHSAGDLLLVELGHRLAACLRQGDTIARLGGDEFGLLLEDLPAPDQAVLVAERIKRWLQQPFNLRGQEVYVTASVGIAVAPREDVDPDTLLRNADTAMYRAKNSGRGSYQLFDDEMRQEVLKTLQMQTALRRSFDRKEFSLVYQPIVFLRTGRVVGFEALTRWKDQHGRPVSPSEFIPIAEEAGLIMHIGEWVLGDGCRQLQQWLTSYPARAPLWISVNLSRRQLAHADLVPQVRRLLQETGLDPSRLMLEITESAIMQDAEDAARTLAVLRALGIRIAIDDFGTGYSSLSLLQRFPIDVVKIDRTVVAELGTPSSDGSQVLRAITSLAANLRLEIVAEGVERAEQVALLQELDCTYGQGHYFSSPQDAISLGALLEDGRIVATGHAPGDASRAGVVVPTQT
jgi:diguanylate cyclase (GGDEF)-like protein